MDGSALPVGFGVGAPVVCMIKVIIGGSEVVVVVIIGMGVVVVSNTIFGTEVVVVLVVFIKANLRLCMLLT